MAEDKLRFPMDAPRVPINKDHKVLVSDENDAIKHIPVSSILDAELTQLNAAKQLADYHFPLLCINTSILPTDIVVSKGNSVLSVDIKTDLFFYYKTQTGTSNYLMPQKQTIDISLKSNTSMVVLGIIFDPKTSRLDTGYRYAYVLIPDDTQSNPILNDSEVFAPILTVSSVATANPIITNGAIYDNIRRSEILEVRNHINGVNKKVDYNYNVEVVTSVDESNFIITKVDSSTATVTINKAIVYATKLSHQRNFVYPPVTTLTIPLVSGSSVATIGIVFKPLDSTITPYGRYDYMLSPSSGDASPILTEGEVFAPLFTISGLPTNTIVMSSGKVLDKIMISKVVDIEKQLPNISTPKPNPLLYSTEFKSEDRSEWGNEFVDNEVGVKLKPNTFYWLKRNYRLNKRFFNLDFNTSNCSKFFIQIYGLENGGAGTNTAFLGINIATQQIILADAYKTDTRNLSVSFEANKDYRIVIHQRDRYLAIKAIDLLSGVASNEMVSVNPGIKGQSPNTGLLYDALSLMTDDTNSPILKKYSIISEVKDPFLWIGGDSITVGFYSTIVDGKSINGYAQLIGEATNMPYLTSGRGGGTISGLLGDTSYIGRLHTELSRLRPTYAMVTIGTNGGHTYEQYKGVIEVILSYGSIPILNNIPLRADNAAFVKTTNAAINKIRLDYGISGARFDLATSINNDGVTINLDLYDADGIHLVDAGHLAMADRASIDIPELF